MSARTLVASLGRQTIDSSTKTVGSRAQRVFNYDGQFAVSFICRIWGAEKMNDMTKRAVCPQKSEGPRLEIVDKKPRTSACSATWRRKELAEGRSPLVAHATKLLAALVCVLVFAAGLLSASQPAKADIYAEVKVGGGGATGSDPCGLAVLSAADQYGGPPQLFSGCSPAPASVVVAVMGYPVPPDGHNSDNQPGIANWISCSPGYVNVTGEGCVQVAPIASTCICTKVGNPIDFLTGSLFEHFVDYETAGPFPLKFERFYANNGQPRFSIFSTTMLDASGSWRSNFEAQMYNPYAGAAYPHALYFALPEGRQLLFVDSTGMGAYVPGLISGSSSVVGGAGGGETVALNTTTSQVTLTTTEGVNYIFALATGQLQTINFRGGYSQTLTYAGASGPPSSVTDNLGRSPAFQYDVNNHLTTLTAGGVTVATYTYVPNSQTVALLAPQYVPPNWPSGIPPLVAQASGTLGSVTRTATGETTSYAYANAGNPYVPTSMTDARGTVYENWTYNAQFQATSSVLAGPVGQTTLSYNPTAQTTTITNALSEQEIVSYTVSAANNILTTQRQKQPIGSLPLATTTYAYDANDFLSQLTDAEGRITTYVNDPTTGLPTSITRGAGTPGASTATYTWNTQWRVPTQIVEPGRTTAYSWSASGQLNSATATDTTTTTIPYSTNGQTRTLTYAYGANGLLLSVTGPLVGEVVSYTYNSSGFIQTITNELGQVTTVTAWNSLGQPTSLTDPNGIVSALGYDGDGRLTSVTLDTAGTPATTTIAYDPVGDITQITDPIGAWTSFTYDGARRLSGISNADGETATYVRDAMGNATSVSLKNSSGAVAFAKTQTFDQLGRLLTSVGVSSQTYTFGYDRTDNLTSVADPASNVFSNGFDALNRLISQTNEDAKTVDLTRSPVDDITAYSDPRNLSTTYVRNGFGDVIQEASPDRGTIVYWRDARGQVTQRTDARGVTFTYTYDLAGRILTETNAANASDNVTYTYDQPICTSDWPIGHLTTVTDVSGTTKRCYGRRGNMGSEGRTIGVAPIRWVDFNYDLAGNVGQMTLPSGRNINYGRDAMGRINQVQVQGGTGFPSAVTVAAPIAYNPYGHPASLTFGNGLVETYGVNTDYHVTSVEVAPASGPALINKTLAWFGQNLKSITDAITPANSETFTYGAAHRLGSASGAYGSLSWTYGANGNRGTQVVSGATQTYNYPTASNKLSSITQSGATTRSFGYDASGNRTSDTTGSVALTEAYDGHGRLITFINGSSTNGAYLYDAFSRLAQRIVSNVTPSGTTQYLYDPFGHVLVETDQNGVSLREYIWLDEMPIGIIDQVNTSNPVLYFVHADHLNRPIMVTNGAGANVWQAIWTPFGAAWSITGSLTYNARFPGQWFQIESGLHYNWSRHYDPSTGRYLQVDPYSDELNDQTQAGTLAGVPIAQGYAANLIRGFDDAVARGAAGQVTAAIGGQVLPPVPTTAASDLLEPLGDPTKGNIIPNAVFPAGPSRYGYAEQSPFAEIDPSGLDLHKCITALCVAAGLANSYLKEGGTFCPQPEISDIEIEPTIPVIEIEPKLPKKKK
jgi:RHS repeat-associated protein